MGNSVALKIAGEHIELLPERAVWWRSARMLLVADLHLGKEHAFAKAGIGVPGAVLDETLARLSRCVKRTGAERLFVAGDLLHAELGTTPELIERVAAWRADLDATIEIVPGNHDRNITDVAARWRLRLHPSKLCMGPFRIVHEPDAGCADRYTWAGHLHPAVELSAAGDSLRLPCFRIGTTVGVLPAFSVFTGRVAAAACPGDRFYAVTPERVFPVPAPLRKAR